MLYLQGQLCTQPLHIDNHSEYYYLYGPDTIYLYDYSRSYIFCKQNRIETRGETLIYAKRIYVIKNFNIVAKVLAQFTHILRSQSSNKMGVVNLEYERHADSNPNLLQL